MTYIMSYFFKIGVLLFTFPALLFKNRTGNELLFFFFFFTLKHCFNFIYSLSLNNTFFYVQINKS
ncbi:hypothetical protein PPACK8108_LOCUS13325 [Phakopsora pachyrhizi]|uniref:Uncharacterized protein n=1 Tax=Phakopsora pachyrhizi TaxID=170000 RepID=A0AAV0B4Q0_PHAPC|nr:hypothetical protein PPACK8108_LOCUS13325 [Phakopsora pachyrhizi]